MAARWRGYLSSPTAVFVAFAFYLFAVWQVVNHVYLMRLPMAQYHMVSLVVETLGAGVVAFFVLRELARKKAQLEELDRQKDMLTNALVHDLRQPLTAVISGLSTAEADLGLPAETKELLGIAHSGGAALLGMVNDLLDVTRMEAGKPTVQLRQVEPREFVVGGTEGLRSLARENDIELVVRVEDGLPEVVVDGGRLRRVVENLVGNALKFTPAGGRVEVEARLDGAGGELIVSVSDTGEGIPEDQQARIFDKFALAGDRRAAGRTSTGLGLTFCKMAVEAHGGRIWVESEPGEGARVAFTVPVGREDR